MLRLNRFDEFSRAEETQNGTSPSRYQRSASKNFISGSLIEVCPMFADKLQGLRCRVATVDEWLSSADAREDIIGAIEQGASKLDDCIALLSA